MLLGTLSASLLGNILAGKRAIAKWQGRGINRAREEVIRAGYENKSVKKTQQNGLLMTSYPLTNFEIQKYYQSTQ